MAAVLVFPLGASMITMELPNLFDQPNSLAGQAEQAFSLDQGSLDMLDIKASPVEANVASLAPPTVEPDRTVNGEIAGGFTAVVADIPADYLALYQAATAKCPGLHWSILAAIGKIESNHGRSTLPGVRTGTNPHGAKGPMQFLQSTFDAVTARHPVPPGGAIPPSPHNPHDAIHTAAAYLCDNGARDNRNLTSAIYAYNHSQAYVNSVLDIARDYRQATPTTSEAPKPSDTPKPSETSKPSEAPRPSQEPKTSQQTAEPRVTDHPKSVALTAVAFARAQLGKPYQWGGNGNPGYDCSGLTTAAYAAAGIKLPRTAQTQYNYLPRLAAGTELKPGDLLFFGTPRRIHHVGISLGGTRMIHAPTFGKTVEIVEDYRTMGNYAGASRPAAATSD